LSPRRFAIAYAIGLVPALAVAVGQPVWSRVDEPAHYDVIAQYAAGVYPHDSVTTIRPETLDVMERTGVYGFIVDSAYQRPDVETGFQQMPSGLTDSQHVLWIRRHGYQYSYEAFQPPLYYALALPAWELGDALGGAFGALYAVRIFDALLAALLAPLSLLIALRLWPQQPFAGWGAACLTAALPGVDVNLTSVTNDVLVAMLGGLTVLVAISGRVTRRRALVVGALLGAALLTKTTAVALVPAVVLAMALRRRGGGPAKVAAALGVAAVLGAPWIASNLALYGEVITTREQLAMSAFPARTAALDFWSVSTLHSFVTFWSGDPFLSLTTAVPLALFAAFLSALAVAGLLRAWRAGAVDRDLLTVLALAAAGAALVSVTSPVLAAFEAPGRLAYVGLPAATALVAVGLWREVPSWRLRRAAVGIFAALAAIGLVVLVFPQPAAPPDPGHPVLAQVRTLDAQGTFAKVTFNLQTCAVDPEHDVWLGLLIENFGSAPAEWSQSAEVRAGPDTLATSDYSRSTPFAMTLLPGFQQTGWLWLGPQAKIPASSTVTVRFRDIAADGYRSIGDVSIPTALC
jgi:hypothetical protein